MDLICNPWITIAEATQCSDCDDEMVDPDLLLEMIQVASELLYVLSGRQWNGVCQETVRPCRKPIIPDDPYWDLVNKSAYEIWQWWIATYWNVTWGVCTCGWGWEPGLSGCSCGPVSAIKLGREEIDSIEQVKIDGVALADTKYVVLERTWLVRTDGEPWPWSQDITKPDTDPNTWSVTFSYGTTPPAIAKNAVRKLACQLTLACLGQACQLPQRAQTITRQGMSIALLDPFEFMENGRTGLYDVDLFLAAVNPHKLQETAMVFSPDYPGRTTIQTTWQAGS